MEPEKDRFANLPAEGVYLLAQYMPDEQLYDLYLDLPSFRRFDDPNHWLWKRLYHDHVSSYPLPDDADYRDQYFWALKTMADLYSRRYPHLEMYYRELAQMGYDRLIPPIDEILPNHQESSYLLYYIGMILIGAAGGGYRRIIDTYLPHYLNEVPSSSPSDYTSTLDKLLRDMLSAALNSPDLELVNVILTFIEYPKRVHWLVDVLAMGYHSLSLSPERYDKYISLLNYFLSYHTAADLADDLDILMRQAVLTVGSTLV